MKGQINKVRFFDGPNLLGFIILVVFSSLIYIPLDFFLSHGYNSYIEFVFEHGMKDLKNDLLQSQNGEFIFMCFKVVPIIIFGWLILIWIDFFQKKRKKLNRFFVKSGTIIYNSFNENFKYLNTLDRADRFALILVLIIQLIAYAYFLFVMPLNYDEWWSYRFFSGQSFWATLSFYPIPNNHIFFNLISGFFTKLPFDVEITLRLPSLLASIISSYYFYKICKRNFNGPISLILLVFVITTFPVIVYSYQARGYGFVNLFCVLLIYSSGKLWENYNNSKYRFLFILSIVLGLLSIPTFVYTLLPVTFVLGVYMLKQKKYLDFLLFFKDGIISILLVVIGYASVLLFNDSGNLLNPNRGGTKFLLGGYDSFEKIINHLKAVSFFLLNNDNFLGVISLLVLISMCFYIFRSKGITVYFCVLSTIMFFSPVFIILVHRVIPFERIWLYLIFPIAICFGFIIENTLFIFYKMLEINFSRNRKIFVYFITVFVCVMVLSLFSAKRYQICRLDFETERLREQYLNPVVGNINGIGYTNAGFEFYAADVIYSICFKVDPEHYVQIEPLYTIKNQDVLIIQKSKLPQFKNSLINYKLLQLFNGDVLIFGKKTIFK